MPVTELTLPTDGPLVSVVIPTYNRAHVIGETLTSVFAQTYRRHEVIVVDDGSTDGTEGALQPFRDRLSYVRTTNRGLAVSRNEGAARVRGEYVAWLDSDDVWAPEKLSLQVAVLQQHLDVVLVSTDFWAFDATGLLAPSHGASYYSALRKGNGGLPAIYGPPVELRFRFGERTESAPLYSNRVREALVMGNFVHPPTVLMRHDAMKSAGKVDPALETASDYEYFIRLAATGLFAHIDRPLLGYRLSGEQLSGDTHLLEIRRSILRAVARLGPDSLGPSSHDRSRYRRRLADCHLRLAAVAASVSSRREAFAHLAGSARLGLLNRLWFKALATAMLPDRGIQAYRRLRRRA